MKKIPAFIIKLFVFCIAFVLPFSINSFGDVNGVESLGPTASFSQNYCYGGVEVYPSLSDNKTFYAVEDRYLYKSNDGGKHFVCLSSIGNSYSMDRQNSNIWYKISNDRLYYTNNGGIEWYKKPDYNNVYYHGDNILDAYGKDVAMWTGRFNIYLSKDGGNSFKETLNDVLSNVYSIAIQSPFVIYVYGCGYFSGCELRESVDGGNSWGKIGTGLALPQNWVYQPRIILDKYDRNKMIVSIDGSGYLSLDGGKSFSQLSLSDNVKNAYFSKNNIFVATDSGIYSTDDNGDTWNFLETGNFYSIYRNDNEMIAGSDCSVYISNDNGTTWNRYFMNDSVSHIMFDDSGTLYSILYGEVYKYNGSDNWTDEGVHSDSKVKFYNNYAYFIYNGDIKKCDLSFDNCTTIENNDVKTFEITKNGSILASMWTYDNGSGIYENDNGSSWKYIGGISTDKTIYHFTYDEDRNILYASSGDLYVSYNFGKTWKDLGINGVKKIQVVNGEAFVSTETGLYIIDGNSFKKAGLQGATEVYSVVENSKNNNEIMAITDNGLYKSNDGGNTWARITYFVNNGYSFHDIISRDLKWYAATNKGVISFEDNDPPTKPTPISPENGGIANSYVTFKWSCSKDPDNDSIKYTVYLAKEGDATFTPINLCSGINTCSCLSNKLDNNTSYYWYVLSSDDKGSSSKSETYNFSVDNSSGQLFKDVNFSSLSWAEQGIMSVYDTGITKGYPGDLFGPDNITTRGEMAAFIARAMGISIPQKCTTSPFPDVAVDAWYCPYVEAIKKYGMDVNYSDGSYKPNDNMNRAWMAVFLAQALNLPIDKCTTSPFPDVAVDAWYCPYVEAIKNVGITTGYPDGTYKPDNPVTRAQMAVFIGRAFLGVK